MVVRGLAKELQPFHERHRSLLIFCTLAGLKIRAVDRIELSGSTRFLLNFCRVLMHIILSSVFMSSLMLILFKKHDDVYEFIHLVMMMGCSTHGAFRQYFMHRNIEKYDELYTAWDEMFGKDADWKARQKTVQEFYTGAKKAIGTLGLWTTVMLTIYSTSSFSSDEKVFRFPTIVPYRHQSPDFELLVSYFAFGIFIFAIAVSSSQMLLITPILWELGEMTRLGKTLAEIFKEAQAVTEKVGTQDGEIITANTYTSLGIATVSKKMKVWVEQHQKLKKFHKMSMALNNFELGMEMVATFIEAVGMAVLCTSDYYAPIDGFTTMCTFVGYFALFYYSCSKCSELSQLSMNVANEAFAENWSSLPLRVKKQFLMITTMTMKPMNYYGAYVFRLDISTFSQIMQTAYSAFNVFYNMVRRN